MNIFGKSPRATMLSSAAVVAMVMAGPVFAQNGQQSAETKVTQGTVATPQTDVQDQGAIIVTAQKRVQQLKDVPQSITVVTGNTLERQEATNLQQYLALVPGLSLTGETRGESRISLRGINTGGVAATVGVYVDDVPFGSSSGLANGAILAGDFDTFDVARIEVLRGPQGTLYGASSLGGVLKFVTNAPNPKKVDARAQAGIEGVDHGGLGYNATAMINLPLSDRIAVRASGFYRKDAGYVDSIGNNPVSDLLDPTNILITTRVQKDLNSVESYGGRVSALFNATDNFSLRLSAIAQNINNAGSDYVEVDPVSLKPLYGGLVQSRYLPEYTKVRYRIYSGVADWNLGFANLTSSTSYGNFSDTFQRDYTLALLAPGLPPLVQILSLPTSLGGLGRPTTAAVNQVTKTDKFTQEVRLTSPSNERFEWLLGGYYTDEKSAIDPQNIVAVDPATGIVRGDEPLLYNIYLRSKYREYAGFVNGTFHFTPRFDLTLGGRISQNEQTASERITGALIGGAVVGYDNLHSKESVFTYSVAPKFKLSKDVSIYGRVATGYRPGGPNVLPVGAPPDVPPTYKADRLTSYEAGLKGDWFDRRLSLDVSAFYLDWNDIQLYAQVNGYGINANGGKAASKGFEFTLVGRPAQGLSVSVNGAYTDAYLRKDTDPQIGGLNGDPLPYIPNWSLNLNADYERPIGQGINGFIGGTVGYVGDRTPDFGVRDANGDLKQIPAYTTVDLRAGVETDHWLAQVYVRNLTDERGITSILSIDPGTYPNDAGAVGLIRPRTIGITIGTRL